MENDKKDKKIVNLKTKIMELEDSLKELRKLMSTGKNNSTNNFILRLWSNAHYGVKKEKNKTKYSGSLTEVKNKEVLKFHSPAQLLSVIEMLYKKAEINKRKKKI